MVAVPGPPREIPWTNAYSFREETVVSSRTMKVVGMSRGTVMPKKAWTLLAPSTLAASYRSGEMFLMPPMYMSM